MLKTALSRHLAALACTLACLSSTAAYADSWNEWLAGMAGLSPQAALERLQQAPAAYRQQADYFYWLGVYTLKAEAPLAQAIEYFEQALMLNPSHAGAWYDYGLVLCRTGDQASCQTILESARAHFGPPPALANVERPLLAISGEVRSHIGHSNNLNSGSQAEHINLWLDGQRIPLTLAGSSRAQGATFGDAAVDLRLVPTYAPQLALALNAYGRTPLQNRDLIGNYRVLAGELTYALTPYQRIGLHSYSMKDTQLGSLSALGTWWQMLHDQRGTHTLLAAERRAPSGSTPSYITLRAEAATRLWRGLEGRFGTESDLPDSNRPGHSQQRLILGLNLPLHILSKGKLEIAGRWQGAQDRAAYSPFFGDTRRKSQTQEIRLRFNWPLTPQIDLRTEARYIRQRSNIPLFDFNERMVSLGLAARF